MFQSESTIYICLNVKELLARNRRDIWRLSYCNGTGTHNHLVRKRTLNHLSKLAWVFVYELSGCRFELRWSDMINQTLWHFISGNHEGRNAQNQYFLSFLIKDATKKISDKILSDNNLVHQLKNKNIKKCLWQEENNSFKCFKFFLFRKILSEVLPVLFWSGKWVNSCHATRWTENIFHAIAKLNSNNLICKIFKEILA